MQAVTMLREDDLDEAKETAETKGELSRERAYDILQALQITATVVDSQRSAWRRTYEATPARQRLEGLASVGATWQNQEQRKSTGRNCQSAFSCAVVFDKGRLKPTERNRQRPAIQAGGLAKSQTIEYIGDIRKTIAG